MPVKFGSDDVRRKSILVLLTVFLVLPWNRLTTPEAAAFEPITMVLLAPVALKVYQAAEPRLVRGMRTGGKKLVQMGVDVFEILYLPLGLVQSTAGAPFGYFKTGVRNMGKGIIAPGKLVLDTLAFPFTLWGVDI